MSSLTEKHEYDIEATAGHRYSSSDRIGDEGAIHSEELTSGQTWYAKTQRFVTKFGVEARGIERVPSDERTDSGMSKIGTLVSMTEESFS